jgi:Sap, sulfolipid-1-addressing protein
MLAQAAGLALLAAVSPTAILIASAYLGSARPKVTVLCYLAGAVLMTTIVAVAAFVAFRSGHLELRSNRTPRYSLRLGLGLLILGAMVVVGRRTPVPLDRSGPGRGIVSRLVANPAPVTALVTGLVVFGPSVTFIAAVQVIATARTSVPVSVLGLIVIIAIDVAFVWLPLLAFLFAPKQTADLLAGINVWLRAHARIVLVTVLGLAAAFLILDGLAGLIRRL